MTHDAPYNCGTTMKRSSHLSLPYTRGPLDPRPFIAVPMKGEQVRRLELSITVTTVFRHKETTKKRTTTSNRALESGNCLSHKIDSSGRRPIKHRNMKTNHVHDVARSRHMAVLPKRKERRASANQPHRPEERPPNMCAPIFYS